MYKVEFLNNNVYIHNIDDFSLAQTLDCGQAFRWVEIENEKWHGMAFNKYLMLERLNADTVVLYNTTEEEYYDLWEDYFDLKRDYKSIIKQISDNEILKKAAQYGNGIKVLNQEPWETLCSFIISQNNNIKRIKGIIARLCENFGEKTGEFYTFPTAQKIASLSLEDLSVLRAGFRAKYILDAAQKVSSGEVDLYKLRDIPLEEAREELIKIKGVGVKGADCALLFSHHHINAFPKDVWIKRALEKLFDGELPQNAIEYAGIVQQYIFFYARETKLQLD